MKVTARILPLFAIASLFSLGLASSVQAAAISDITATPSTTSVTIQWTTDIAASSQVLYGSTSSYGSQTTETDTAPRVLTHSVTVTGLTACTPYHFQPKSMAVSFANTIILGVDTVVTTTGCATATTTTTTDTTPTPTPTGSLAETGDAPYLYLVFLGALLTVGYSIGRLRRQS